MKNTACLAVLLALVVCGCDDKKGDSLANRAGESVGKHITDFTKGVGKGIDQTMIVDVSVSPEVLGLGLTNTIAKSLGMGATNGISVYFIASHQVSSTLVARAVNAEGVEIGRSKKSISMEKDEADYVTFTFSEQMDTAMVKKYLIGL